MVETSKESPSTPSTKVQNPKPMRSSPRSKRNLSVTEASSSTPSTSFLKSKGTSSVAPVAASNLPKRVKLNGKTFITPGLGVKFAVGDLIAIGLSKAGKWDVGRVLAVKNVGENMTVKVHYQQPAGGLFVSWKLRNGMDYIEEINAASIFHKLPHFTATVDVQKNLTERCRKFFS